MNDQVLRTQTDRRQLQQIIAGLTEGVILIEPDQRILWANEAAWRCTASIRWKAWAPIPASIASAFACATATIIRCRRASTRPSAWWLASASATWWWKCFPPPTRTPAGCTACAGWC